MSAQSFSTSVFCYAITSCLSPRRVLASISNPCYTAVVARDILVCFHYEREMPGFFYIKDALAFALNILKLFIMAIFNMSKGRNILNWYVLYTEPQQFLTFLLSCFNLLTLL